VRSVEAEGTVFTVSFPGHTELTPEPVDTAGAPQYETLVGLRVLLVEDEPDALDFVLAALQHYGVDVSAVSSSHAALEALDVSIAAGTTPDVIISDIGLPDEDGYRLMEQLGSRGKSLGGRIPVIALTAYGRPQDKRRALAAGFRMHLTKPITPEALASALAVLAPKR
jgi:CheY-like chemotaxis protein